MAAVNPVPLQRRHFFIGQGAIGSLESDTKGQTAGVVADALAGNRTLAYSLKGTVSATPQEKKQRRFDVDSRSTLNQAPGLPGVLR